MRASSAGVRVHVARNGHDVARVGFAPVGVRSAVQRNLLRRRLREAVRPLLPVLAGHDAVVVAGVEACAMTFSALSAAVATSINRALQRQESAVVPSRRDNAVMAHPPEPSR